MADGKVIIEVDAEDKGFRDSLTWAKKAAVEASKELEQSGKSITSVGKSISDVGEKISKIGTSMTKYITTPVLAAGTAAVKFASDYNENLNKVDASFKDSADVVKEWAKTATEQFGLSESAALEATSLFGDMGTSMGLTTEQAAEMAISLTGLAGDLSSFKNIGIDQAMTALKGVFTGETESLKELGVVMTETNLKEFADGLGLVYDEMSQTEKVTLRYQYVLDKTKNAQGDYSRTSDEAANSLRTMKAEAENLGVAFGEELLPSITPLIQDATELIRKFGELDESTKQNIIQAGLFVAAIGPVTTVVGKATEGIGTLVKGAGNAVGAIGEFTSALSGGAGLGSALVSTLGTGGTVGLAVAGTAALAGGIYALVTNIRDAHDPVLQLEQAIEGVSAAQESISVSQNIIDLANRYEELRAKMSDTSLSASELSAVESELDGVRAQLSSATGGAVSAEGDYNSELDQTVAVQKTLAEIEKDRAKSQLYDFLVEGADDYKNALNDLEEKQAAVTEAENEMQRASNSAANDADAAYQGLFDTLAEIESQFGDGVIDIDDDEQVNELRSALDGLEAQIYDISGIKVELGSLDDARAAVSALEWDTGNAAETAENASDSYNALKSDLDVLTDTTSKYESVALVAVEGGLISVEDAAAALEMSVEELDGRLNQYKDTTKESADSTEGLGDAAGGTSDKLDEEAQAAEEASNKLRDIGNSAVDAKYAGGDLREAYDELSSQFDDVKESGAETAVKFAELALESLNLAATNQELVESYSGYVDVAGTIGVTLSDLSSWLINNGLTAEEWGSQVDSATESVINGFEKLDTSLDMSLDTMAENLRYNIDAYSNWNSNIQQLMAAAEATGSQTAVDFVMYMQQMGIGSAAQVQAMVDDIDGTMETFPPLMGEAIESGMITVYNGIEGNKINVSEATADVMGGAAETIEGTDLGSAATTSSSEIPGAISEQKGAVEAATNELAMAAHSTIATIGWTDLGNAIAQGIANGISNNSGLVASAAGIAAESINLSQFENVGLSSGQAFSTGIRSQEGSMRSAAQTLATSVTTIWTNYSGRFQQSGSVAGTRIRTGLTQQLSSIRSAGQNLANSVTDAWRATMGRFQQTGSAASSSLASGISSGQSTVTGAASSVIYAAQSAMNIGGWYDLGYNISAGVASGVRGGSYLITQAAQSAAQSALSSAKESLGVQSPSRVFQDEVGKMIPAGIALGIEKATPVATDAMALSTEQLLQATEIALRPSGTMATPQYIINNHNTTYQNFAGGNGGGGLVIETPVYLDGREIARAIAKPTGRQMAYLEGL